MTRRSATEPVALHSATRSAVIRYPERTKNVVTPTVPAVRLPLRN